ncbi:MAG: DUF3164 family protein [Cyclobacteriaceae bacterium]|nr:DUF3164 family protein [Cyclobacteriaceae bacterium]
MNETDVNELSVQELENMLASRKEALRIAREKERADYEKDRDKKIADIMQEAIRLQNQIAFFKQKCHEIMDEQAAKLEAYGAIRGNSKGGFSITNAEGKLRVTRRRDTMPYWDERATKGVEFIKEFLHSFVKKRDKKLFEILISFLEKNNAGELEYSKVMHLMRHEDKFTDPKWQEGLALIKEGYMVTMKAYGYEFRKMTGDGKWENIGLNFSSI